MQALEILTYGGRRTRVGPPSPGQLCQIIAAGGRTGEIRAGLASLGGRYGDQARAEILPLVPGAELTDAFAQFKRI